MSHLLFKDKLSLFFYIHSQIIGQTLSLLSLFSFLHFFIFISLLFQQSEDFFGLRRLYVILGSCLFYKVGVFFIFL